MTVSQVVVVPISIGELLDKISILAIKLERVEDSQKRENIMRELTFLETTRERELMIPSELHADVARLGLVNTLLWDVEEFLRCHEESQDFGSLFVVSARSIYLLNDERARIKRRLNQRLYSDIIEEKSYCLRSR